MKFNKDKRLAFTQQAKDILYSLSLEEKVSLMSGRIDFKEVRDAIRKKLSSTIIIYLIRPVDYQNITFLRCCFVMDPEE